MSKAESADLILKLYDLRREKKMRKARNWIFGYNPTNVEEYMQTMMDPEVGGYLRMVVSYWDTAASLVLNGGIDQKMFLDANTEHIFVYAKIADFLPEVRQLFREADFLIHLENLCRAMPDFEVKLEGRKRLISLWNQKTA